MSHILVIDDEKLIRWSLRERLTREGHTVAEAEDGRSAAAAHGSASSAASTQLSPSSLLRPSIVPIPSG